MAEEFSSYGGWRASRARARARQGLPKHYPSLTPHPLSPSEFPRALSAGEPGRRSAVAHRLRAPRGGPARRFSDCFPNWPVPPVANSRSGQRPYTHRAQPSGLRRTRSPYCNGPATRHPARERSCCARLQRQRKKSRIPVRLQRNGIRA